MTHSTLDITAALVHDLVREQHPDLAGRPVRLGARGWANQVWRLGDDLAVRLPWVVADTDELLLNEHTWVPRLAPGLPLPVPVPQRLGVPSARFPRPWLITTWVPGEPADRAPVTDPAAAGSLAAFLTALHRPAPAEAPAGQDRGGPLAERSDGFAGGVALAVERGLIDDPDAVRAVWQDAVTAPAWAGPRMWLHADLHPANVVTRGGRLCGIVDFGDLCAGDPAYDLSAAWLLLPDGGVDDFYAAYRPAADAATRRRARGWAMARVLSGLLIGDNGVHGRPGGKATWGPPARAALHRLTSAR
ncbi:Predicted kinase, aminoglycoside phosphotransferase (APT) family [Actinoplanes philippinensis]|uniref:Predicted kinase, aminoglycoside phosphotransferase (APT) family n=1 Tax=Actinoplanes philippinensis TaxID=35752 RepID=A0A1I2E9L4_9ACTN|nr:aminoglycoside phosphotransferase family protein [Actinoplanes philippinensis]SFE88950.1 Predicted kinase, aminoglycoside phosphotransferase (APT) family [Actinoplanes philippinensis]